MKKTFVLPGFILCLTLVACKKERTCECTSTYSSSSISSSGVPSNYNGTPQTTKTVYKKVSKADIGYLCGDRKTSSSGTNTDSNGNTSTGTGTSETKCTIK